MRHGRPSYLTSDSDVSLSLCPAYPECEDTFLILYLEVRGMKGIFIVNQQGADGHIKTLISFDQGGAWRPIPAPKNDINGTAITCKQVNCSLHLHLKISSFYYGIRFPYILSENNAPGIIMAQGVMGTYLTHLKSSFYLSRDGGITWTPQFEGNHIYNILDQGGAMVVVKEKQHNLASEILYSCTEGASWQIYPFSKDKFYVDDIVNEPGINTLIVSIFGHFAKNTMSVQAITRFGRLLTSMTVDNAFWDRSCHTKRRKRMSECCNGNDYEKTINVTHCVCTEDDYVCDYGYERHGVNCVATLWLDPSVPLSDCPEGTKYNKTKGYRKVAADKCTMGDKDFVSRVHPDVDAKCPVVKPGGLDVTMSSKQAAVTRKSVVFHLTQEMGSKMSTVYTWDFGDSKPVTLKGLKKAQNCTKTFKRGLHTVTVTAKNSMGSAKTSLTFMVEDKIRGVYVVTPHGAKVNRPVDFDLNVISDSYDARGTGQVHFLWTFGDEGLDDRSLLTWKNHVTHVYRTAQNYSVRVEAVNSVSSYLWTFTLPVYQTLVTVQLTFTEGKGVVKEDTPMWRRMLDDALKRALASRMFVSEQCLEVVTVKLTPLTVDVSILPISFSPQMDKLAERLIAATRARSVVLTLDPKQFGISNITAVHAEIISEAALTPHKARSYLALYICLPILLVAVFIGVLVAVYYKKKLTSLRRYRILGEPGGPDNLLDGTDDDDDDPLLDSELSGHRLALSDDTDDPFGAQMIGMSEEHSPDNC
ncbi:VPS10 domain-containing receptor SorCS1 [Lamellibrachia satsuma]|nr:VPS10 domain-containing receptor SorCS1 [Lamellibrachia satsuma]